MDTGLAGDRVKCFTIENVHIVEILSESAHLQGMQCCYTALSQTTAGAHQLLAASLLRSLCLHPAIQELPITSFSNAPSPHPLQSPHDHSDGRLSKPYPSLGLIGYPKAAASGRNQDVLQTDVAVHKITSVLSPLHLRVGWESFSPPKYSGHARTVTSLRVSSRAASTSSCCCSAVRARHELSSCHTSA